MDAEPHLPQQDEGRQDSRQQLWVLGTQLVGPAQQRPEAVQRAESVLLTLQTVYGRRLLPLSAAGAEFDYRLAFGLNTALLHRVASPTN